MHEDVRHFQLVSAAAAAAAAAEMARNGYQFPQQMSPGSSTSAAPLIFALQHLSDGICPPIGL